MRRLVTRGRGTTAALLAALVLTACAPQSPPPPPQISGFDTCAAPSTTTMQKWLASKHRVIGIYLGGRNRACPDGNLSPSWITTVAGQGWRFLPIWVGYQAPCTSASRVDLLDPAQAAEQGKQEADDAAARAAYFGLGPGNPIYYDMEAYGRNVGCINAVLTFLSAWTDELRALGYKPGIYSSAASGITDQVNVVKNNWPFSWPDQIWIANWDDRPTVGDDPYVPNGYWKYQRHRQWKGPHNETWGQVTLNIDSDLSVGATAAP